MRRRICWNLRRVHCRMDRTTSGHKWHKSGSCILGDTKLPPSGASPVTTGERRSLLTHSKPFTATGALFLVSAHCQCSQFRFKTRDDQTSSPDHFCHSWRSRSSIFRSQFAKSIFRRSRSLRSPDSTSRQPEANFCTQITM